MGKANEQRQESPDPYFCKECGKSFKSTHEPKMCPFCGRGGEDNSKSVDSSVCLFVEGEKVERMITAGDTPDGCNWQIVEVVGVGNRMLEFEQVRYGVTRENAETIAEKQEEWAAVPMPGWMGKEDG